MADGNFSLIIQTNKQLEIRKGLSHKELLQQLTVIFQTNVEKIYADKIKEKKTPFHYNFMKYGRGIYINKCITWVPVLQEPQNDALVLRKIGGVG